MFDLISDLHLEAWLRYSPGRATEAQKICKLVESILPDYLIYDTILIPGDISQFNDYIKIFLQYLQEHYKNIVLVPGNHEFYLPEEEYRYSNSLHKFNELKDLCGGMEGVFLLDGEVVEIKPNGGNALRVGGTTGWYDFSYGYHLLKDKGEKNTNLLYKYWQDECVDSLKITGLGHPLEIYKQEKKKLQSIVREADIILTHISPDASQIAGRYKNELTSAFYYFDGLEFWHYVQDKVWCFGHTHENLDYKNYGCRFITNALGMPYAVSKVGKVKNCIITR